MQLPRVTISGARGVIGEDLTVESALCLARAFATLIGKGMVIVARDTRRSGQMIQAAVEAGLTAEGCDVVRIGLAPTPSVGIMVRKRCAAGAVNITASHNPPQWNALKFYNNQGLFITVDQTRRLVDLAGEQQGHATGETCGTCRDDETALETHCRLVLDNVDRSAIVARGYSIAVDGCRSVGGIFLPRLLRELGCKVIELDCQPDGRFTRRLEPIPSALDQLRRSVRENECDAGFAVDPDADRLSLVDESGTAIGEEYTLAIAVGHVLRRMGGGVAVVNLSTSMMVDAAAAAAGGRVLRTPIGEAHVVEAMLREKAAIGGEGNGGVIYPTVHPGRDALAGAALILESMALTGMSLAELARQLPRTTIVKDKVEAKEFPPDGWTRQAAIKVPGARIDTTDGLKVVFEDGWYHIRVSNTEPVLRIMAEATSPDRAHELLQTARRTAHTVLGTN